MGEESGAGAVGRESQGVAVGLEEGAGSGGRRGREEEKTGGHVSLLPLVLMVTECFFCLLSWLSCLC